jgi:hypothetical protein
MISEILVEKGHTAMKLPLYHFDLSLLVLFGKM